MLFAISLTTLVLFALCIESLYIRHRVQSIRLRIHVNGTRGKSSVTRYIAAALRASGRPTVAKVTGEIPLWIDTNGAASIIKRRGTPRVQEQFRLISRVVHSGAGAMVLECMSINPEYQQLESRFFQPHIYIITNIRDDHQEELGGHQKQQIDAICSAIPPRTQVICLDGIYRNAVEKAVKKQGGTLTVVNPENIMPGKPGVFVENIGLALSACVAAGMEYAQALHAILDEANRSELLAWKIPNSAKNLHFVNGFSVNDIQSAETFLRDWRQHLSSLTDVYVLFNTRADRPLRSRTFAHWLAERNELAGVMVTGNHKKAMQHILRKSGMEPEQIQVLSNNYCKNIVTCLERICPPNSLILGLGNIGGLGFEMVHSLKKAINTGVVDAD